ncbi:MAG: glycoside hydrolase family 88 protein [Oscillospiraceae bacterium]|jgi:unsaturated rhamnogalacturonyl hydrolase|nr:glycoside hydrolase family 88 protein [Oscillospiraceae bacterium]
MQTAIEKVLHLARGNVKRYPAEKMKWMWGEALWLYALSLLDEAFGTAAFRPYLQAYYDTKLDTGYRVCSSDTCAPALGAYQLTKTPGGEKYGSIVDRVLRYFAQSEKVIGDMPNHLGNGFEHWFYPKSVWVDSIMMYGVLLNRIAAETENAQLAAFAAGQPQKFADLLQDPDTGLFWHAYWTKFGFHYPRQALFWGRGNGWVMAAVPLMWDYIQEDAQRAVIQAFFLKLARALLPLQRADGWFETILLPQCGAYKESSATMLIAAGWFFGVRMGWLGTEYLEAAQRAFTAVTDSFVLRDGLLSMPHISGPTSAIQGIPKLVYTHTPCGNDWHYGLAAAVFAALEYKKLAE